MAADIVKSISANAIKNGSVVLNKPLAAYSSTQLSENSYVNNNPLITDIQDKYTERFDDINYYEN